MYWFFSWSAISKDLQSCHMNQFGLFLCCCCDGCNPAPVDRSFIQFSWEFDTSQVVQDSGFQPWRILVLHLHLLWCRILVPWRMNFWVADCHTPNALDKQFIGLNFIYCDSLQQKISWNHYNKPGTDFEGWCCIQHIHGYTLQLQSGSRGVFLQEFHTVSFGKGTFRWCFSL